MRYVEKFAVNEVAEALEIGYEATESPDDPCSRPVRDRLGHRIVPGALRSLEGVFE